ncbi:hypothetical protein HDU84_003784 [Entophlyctis sp. JEL0112]|nr:hypothetical protein HDU84_003784 [Entophlyctis sp. JEL0112]
MASLSSPDRKRVNELLYIQDKILFWVEAVALAGFLKTFVAELSTLFDRLQTLDQLSQERAVFRDLHRLVFEFFDAINDSPLSTYFSAVPWIPEDVSRRAVSNRIAQRPDLQSVIFSEEPTKGMGILRADAGGAHLHGGVSAVSWDGKWIVSEGQ